MVHPFLTLHIAHRIVPCSIVKCFILPFYILFVTTAYIFQQLCTVTQSCPILLSVIECSLTNEKNVMIQLKIHEMRFDYMNNPYDENNQQMGYGQEPHRGRSSTRNRRQSISIKQSRFCPPPPSPWESSPWYPCAVFRLWHFCSEDLAFYSV